MAPPRRATRSAHLASSLVLGVGIAFGLLAFRQLDATADELEAVTSTHAAIVIHLGRAQAAVEALGRTARSFLATDDPTILSESRQAASSFSTSVGELRHLLERGPARSALESFAALQRRYVALVETAFARAPREEVRVRLERLDREIQPVGKELRDAVSTLASSETRHYAESRQRAVAGALRGRRVLLAIAMLSLGGAGALTFVTLRAIVLLGRTRRALEEANDRLQVANRELDAFAGRTAHDLRNVLSPISLIGARLRSRGDDPDAVRETATRLDHVAARSERLIAALLQLARAGRAVPDGRAPLRVVLDEVLEDLTPLMGRARVAVRVDAPELEIACSPGLLHVVLANVIGNAVKYMGEGATREVRVTAARDGPLARIAVTDTGPGIPTEWRERVFTPFVRVPGTAPEGCGIGLATVQRIVVGCGGRVELRSQLGTGTQVIVHLPAAREAARLGTSGAS